MNTKPTQCPKCGAELPTDAPQGLCPRCLAALNFDTETMATSARPVPVQPTLTPEELAPHFPQLEILECLGRGGMGVVYKARQKSLNRLVALKLLAPERADDAKFAARFEKEAHALAALNHPHIVTIHDFGQAGGFFFLLMEFVDGVNLRQAMSAGRFTPPQALAIVPPVCEALQYAHDHGIVHRDIKPENLLMDKDGRVKIADFGIAKIVAREASRGEGNDEPRDDSRTTMLGTPAYAAPEQQSDPTHVDHRADIYSLGVVLYELLTGELPKADLEAPSRRVEIDVRLDEIVLRALEARPDRRYSTADEFRTQLATITSGTPPREGTWLKTATSYVSTPSHLTTLYGRFAYIYTGKGQLVLDDQRLTFSRLNEAPTVIPLSSIRDLSIGQYPATAKPIALNFISVTYDDRGTTRQLLFTPNVGALSPAWDTNRLGSEWFKAIQDATRDVTGKVPTTTPANQLGVPSGSTTKLLPVLPILAGAGLMLLAFSARHLQQMTQMILMMLGFLLMLVGPILVGYFTGGQREEGDRARRPWRWAGGLSVILGFTLLIGGNSLNQMVSDFELTAAVRDHVRKDHQAIEQNNAARSAVDSKISELNAAHAQLEGTASPAEKQKILETAQRLTREANEVRQAAANAEMAQAQAVLAKEREEQHRRTLLFLIAGALIGLGAVAFFYRSRTDGESDTHRRSGLGCVFFCILAFEVAMALISLWAYQRVDPLHAESSVLKSVSSELVSVEGNIVTVELSLQVAGGPVEVRAKLYGNRAPDDKELPLVDSDRNTGQRTLVLPGAPLGNQPWRSFQPGMHLWRLRYVLPTPKLAREAAGNLRPMGELPTGYAGTVFQVGDTAEPDYLALLSVSEIMTSADPDWVEVEGQRSWNESATRATWTVRASRVGLIHLIHDDSDSQRKASLKRHPKTKFFEATVQVEITKVSPGRVKVATTIGGGTVATEFTGDYLQIRDELLDTALNSAKSETGTRVELCRLEGSPLILQVPVIVATPSTQTIPAKVVTVEHAWGSFIMPFVVLAVVLISGAFLIRSLQRQGRSGCAAALIIVLGLMLLFVTASVVWYLSMARQVERPAPAPAQKAKVIEAPGIPMVIDFKVVNVENPPGTRVIRVFFERDANYGLGIEVWQDARRAPDGRGPSADDPFWLRKQWIGLNGSSSLSWTLPDDFTPEEVMEAARQIEREQLSKGQIQLSDGAVPEIGHVKHRDGWTYIMALRILREPGAPRPPAPKGDVFSVEKEIIVPGYAFVRVQLQKSAKDGKKVAEGDPLVFKTANTAKGFILRWHAYAPPLPDAGPNYMLDFVDPDSGAIFHRIEDGFPSGVALSSPDSLSLPAANKSVMIAAPGTTTILRLLRASQQTTPDAALTAWWDVYAEVTHVSPRSKPVPQFQLPDR